MTKRGAKKESAEATEEKKLSNHVQRKLDERKKGENSFDHICVTGALKRNVIRCED